MLKELTNWDKKAVFRWHLCLLVLGSVVLEKFQALCSIFTSSKYKNSVLFKKLFIS